LIGALVFLGLEIYSLRCAYKVWKEPKSDR
jgi:hypothetical protein